MDDPKIGLYLDSKSGSAPAWNWKLLLQGEKIAGGKSPGTQEIAFAAAREALGKERERGPNVRRSNPTLAVFGQCSVELTARNSLKKYFGCGPTIF